MKKLGFVLFSMTMILIASCSKDTSINDEVFNLKKAHVEVSQQSDPVSDMGIIPFIIPER